MDKNVLKKFAIESRQELMEKVTNKISRYYVDEEFDVNQNGEVYVLVNDKHTLRLTKGEYENRQLLIKRIKEITLEQVIEEAAYTWFNRIIAIRYMEIHDYLPLTKDNQSLGVRVLSSKDNTPDPEIMKISNLMNPDLDINFNKEYYGSIQDNNKRFEYVLLLICKKLGRVIPQVFDGITDYIDILIPDNLLNESGYVTKLLKDVSEDNFKEVEIIGWLYQYYNQSEKDRVISAKKAYKKNEIPYATQLFTPDWIVKYMVENSLGRYWVEHNGGGSVYPAGNLYSGNNLYPSSSITNNWKYFIKENIEKEKDKLSPTEITFIDPCCGSGHILVYAFEVFYQIYLKSGFNKNDIPELILKNNLYGLDIDDRAGQLSILSVLLKSREYDKTIFNKDIVRNLNIMSIQESNNISKISVDNISNENIRKKAIYLIEQFKNAKEIGSLLILENTDYSQLEESINNNETIFGIELGEKLLPIIKIAKILSQKYDIIVTNPPYMNTTSMSKKLKEYIIDNYIDYKYDLFSAFIIKNTKLAKDKSYIGVMTPFVWMFIASYEKLRKYIIENLKFSSLIQLEYSALEEATVPICTFILSNKKDNNNGIFIRLTDYKGGMSIQEKKYLYSINNNQNIYIINQEIFKNIPGQVIAYWATPRLLETFQSSKKISDYGIARQGMTTSDNKRFLRLWYEVDINKANFNARNLVEAKESKLKWFPYNKGGAFRKWYGNNEYFVNFYNDGEEMEKFHKELNKTSSGGRIKSKEYYFKESITWTFISSSSFGVRYSRPGAIFDVAGSSLFVNNNIYYILGFLCTKLVEIYNNIMNPTMNMQSSNVSQLPLIFDENKKNIIEDLAKDNISISKSDWDSFETSWDFKKHPLLEFRDSMPGLHDSNIKVTPTHLKIIRNNYGEECYIADELPMNARISDSFRKWKEYTQKQFNTLKKNEEKLNEIFIDIYGLKDELTPEVADKDITIRKADKEREIKSLISYAVGCMFGRYSLDKEGLIYAGGDFDKIYKKYKESDGGWAGASLSNYKVLNDNGKEISLSFEVDNDDIIPITDEAYLEDDIVERFKKFISVAYGEETLYENLEFIAETLGKRNGETSEDTIRRYFISDFYNDHLKIYQKRPIYWLFDSGKKNGFKCLIYMHRYNEGIVSKIRLDYLHKTQNLYEKELKEISDKLDGDIDLTKKRELAKRQADISAKLQETKEYDEKIAHIADQKIKLDLDDGVVVNYAKFSVKNPKTGKEESILAKIK